MIIQFKTDTSIKVKERFSKPLISIASEKLKRFSDQITELEINLSDEKGTKEGLDNKRCMIEAHINDKSPIAVTFHATNHKQAMEGAIDKLKASLHILFGRLNKYQN